MWSFRQNRLLEPVDITVANLMAALGRYQGRQDLYKHQQAPQVLETLRQIAVIESTEASNRIEGLHQPGTDHRAQAIRQYGAENELIVEQQPNSDDVQPLLFSESTFAPFPLPSMFLHTPARCCTSTT